MPDLTPQQIIEFFNTLSPTAAIDFFKKLETGSKVAAQAMNGLHSGVQAVKQITQETVEKAGELKNTMLELAKTRIGDVVQSLSSGNKELLSLVANAALLTAALAGVRSDTLNALAQSASDVNLNFDHTVKALDQFGLADNKIVKVLISLNQAAAPVRNLEAGLIGAASASGELGSLLGELGPNFENMSKKVTTFVEKTFNLAQASGLSTTQVAGFAAQLSVIPGAMSTMVDLTEKGGKQIDLLDASMKVASGTGQKFEAVVNDLNEVYRNYNTTGEKALQFVTRLSAASAGLKIPLDIVKDYTRNASAQFKFFGDNTQAALNILGKFGPVLKASGLGPAAIAELTRGMTDNIARLDVAQRAFVSQTAGGAGGLQGSYQVELLKQKGQLDKVQSMVEQSLRQQFGGKIVTLEQAANSQASAAQFTKQVQLLTSGPTKIANSEGEAYKIIEAMSKGFKAPIAPGGEKETIATPDEALKKSLETGTLWQERNYNQLTVIANRLDLIAMHGALTADAANRSLLGPGLNKKLTQEQMTEGSQAASQQSLLIKGTTNKELGPNEAIMERFEKLGSVFDGFKSLQDSFENMLDGLKGEVDKLSGSVLVPGKSQPATQETPTQKIIPFLGEEEQKEKKTGVKTSSIGSTPQTLEINQTLICPSCQKKDFTQVASLLIDGSISNFRKGEVNHIHTGANLG